MADAPVVHIGENSPEEVAFKLMKTIADVEGKLLYFSKDHRDRGVDRAYVLNTYAECLEAVLGRRDLDQN